MKDIIKFFLVTVIVIVLIILIQMTINTILGFESQKLDNNDLGFYNDETWKNSVFHFVTTKPGEFEGHFYMDLHVYDDFNDQGILVDKITASYKTHMRYRGSSSAAYPKKQFKLNILKDDSMKDRAVSLLGLNKESNWVLNGPYLDKSYTRTYMMYDLSRSLFDWAPQVEFLEVFVDGDYQGIYLLIESIEGSKSRLDLNEFGLLNGQIPFIVKRDRVDEGDMILSTYAANKLITSNDLLLVEPNPDKISEIHKSWIETYISEFEEVLYSSDFNDVYGGYSQYIDVDNFVDYYVLNLFSHNNDAGNLSTYIYKDLDTKMKLVPWDFNNAIGLYHDNTPDIIDNEAYNWFSRLLEDPNFRNKVVDRYYDLRQGILSDDYLENFIESYQTPNKEAFLRDIKKWYFDIDQSFSPVPIELTLFRQENSTKNMKKFMYEMTQYLDENIEKQLKAVFSK